MKRDMQSVHAKIDLSEVILSHVKKFMSANSICLILTLATIIFLNSLKNGFVYDDWVLMVYNEVYRSFDIKQIFLSKANSFEYLPFRDITLAIDAQLWGMKPFGFHLSNLLLYLAGLIAMFRMVKNLTHLFGEEKGDFIAFWTTLIFALHPLHAEVVNFIAARNNLLAALFLFLSLNFCINGIYKKKNHYIFFSTLLFIASLFSKASVVFYPFFLMAVFLLVPKTIMSARKKTVILFLFFVINGLAIWVHYKIASATAVMNENIFRFGSYNIPALMTKALHIPFFYLKKLIVPYPLSTDYPISFESGAASLTPLLFLLYVLIALFIAHGLRKKHYIPVMGITWFFLSLLPVLNIFPTSPIVADRYAYLAVLGFGLVAAFMLKAVAAWKKEVLYIAWGIMAVWGSVDFIRNMDWRSDATLWTSAVSVNPYTSRSNLATALWNKGEYEKALAYFKEERDRTGSYEYSLYQGRYLFQSGKYADAITFYQKALNEGAGALKETHLFIAQAYERTGSDMLAIKHYKKVFETKSLDPLGEYAKKAGDGMNRIRERLSLKLGELRNKALLEPDNFQSQSSFATFLYDIGSYAEAEKFYLKSLEINPSAWDVWYNLGNVYIKLDKYKDAIKAFEKSLLIKPDNTAALRNIGISYMALQQYHQASQYYERVLYLDPNNLYAAFNLGKIYFNSGDSEKAKKYFSLAKSLAKGNDALQKSIDQFIGKIQG